MKEKTAVRILGNSEITVIDLNLFTFQELAEMFTQKSESGIRNFLKKMEGHGFMKVIPKVNANKRLSFEQIKQGSTGFPSVDSVANDLLSTNPPIKAFLLFKSITKANFEVLSQLMMKIQFVEELKNFESSFQIGLAAQVGALVDLFYYLETGSELQEPSIEFVDRFLMGFHFEYQKRNRLIKNYSYELTKPELAEIVKWKLSKGEITKIKEEGNYGFIKMENGQEIYFKLQHAAPEVAVGDKVIFGIAEPNESNQRSQAVLIQKSK